MRLFDLEDKVVFAIDKALDTLLTPKDSTRPYPAETLPNLNLYKEILHT